MLRGIIDATAANQRDAQIELRVAGPLGFVPFHSCSTAMAASCSRPSMSNLGLQHVRARLRAFLGQFALDVVQAFCDFSR